ncbi:MAG TPA: ABC transporter substrate-binding protein/permease [Bacteroidales bacterium]|nr:ABC transporter substrate-binding protein/permease [Bacteroidales bacterium]
MKRLWLLTILLLLQATALPAAAQPQEAREQQAQEQFAAQQVQQVQQAQQAGQGVPSEQEPVREERSVLDMVADSLLAGHKVAVMTGSLGEIMLSEGYPQVIIQCFDDIMDGFAALHAGKVSYVLTAYTTAYVVSRSNPSYRILPYHLTNEGAGVAVAKNNTTGLLGKIDSVLAGFRHDGTLDKIIGNWIRQDGTDYVVTKFDVQGSSSGAGRLPPLRVGTSANREPMCFVRNNTISGLDWELMMRIGQALGREVVFVDMKYAALIAALQSGKVDAVASNMTATAERRKQVDFSAVYFVNPQVLVEWIPATAAVGAADVSRQGFWEKFADSLYRNLLLEKRYMLILDGLWVTILISVLSVIFGTLAGAGICALRMSRNTAARTFAKGYITLFRAIPQVVILMVMFYVVFATARISGIFVSVLTFSMIFASYSSELFRTSLEAIPAGQRYAGYAMGFNKYQTFRYILLPQAARIALPVYKGEIISLIKMTAVVGYIAVQDLTKAGDIIRSRTFDALFPLLMVTVIYMLIIWGFTGGTSARQKTKRFHNRQKIT